MFPTYTHKTIVAWLRVFRPPNRKAQTSLSKVHFPLMTGSQCGTMHHCVRALCWSSVCTVWHLWHSRRVLPRLCLSMRDRLMEEDKALTSFWNSHRTVSRTNVPHNSDIPLEPIRRSEILYDKWIWRPNGSILSWVLNTFLLQECWWKHPAGAVVRYILWWAYVTARLDVYSQPL